MQRQIHYENNVHLRDYNAPFSTDLHTGSTSYTADMIVIYRTQALKGKQSSFIGSDVQANRVRTLADLQAGTVVPSASGAPGTKGFIAKLLNLSI